MKRNFFSHSCWPVCADAFQSESWTCYRAKVKQCYRAAHDASAHPPVFFRFFDFSPATDIGEGSRKQSGRYSLVLRWTLKQSHTDRFFFAFFLPEALKMDVKRKVSLKTTQDTILCCNDWPISVTIQLSVQGSGISLGNNLQLTSLHVIPPYAADVELAQVLRQGPSAQWSCDFRGAFGAPANSHDDSQRYQWPYQGSFVCALTFGGDPAPNLYHSVEFLPPHGTPILAARRGTVFVCGKDSKLGLFCKVSHHDGSVATYSSLARVIVEEGSVVKEGNQVGVSGPNFRFTLQVPNGSPGLPPSHPYVFDDGSPSGVVPQLNKSYPTAHAPLPARPGPAAMNTHGGQAKQPMKKMPMKKMPMKKMPMKKMPMKQMHAGGGDHRTPPPPPARSSGPPPPPQHQHHQPPPPPQAKPAAEWTGSYASPGLLPVTPKPPSVNRSDKPVLARGSQSQNHAAVPPPYQTVDPSQSTSDLNSSMMPGHRSAPPSKALYPDYVAPEEKSDPNVPEVQNSMTPGYQRETNFVDETKRTLDIRRHNPVKNGKKKLSVATPSSRDMKNKLRNIF